MNRTLTINANVRGNADKKLKDIAGAEDQLMQKTGKLQGTTRTYNNTLLSTSRIVQDLPFGFMAIGNNITFLAEEMGRAKAAGVGFGAQLKGMLGALAGPGGMIFAISAVTSLITAFSMGMFESKEKSEELTKSIRDQRREAEKLRNEYERMTRLELSRELKDINIEIKSQTEAIKERLDFALGINALVDVDKVPFASLLGLDLDLTKEEINALKELRKEQSEVEKQLSGGRGRIPTLRARINQLQELRDNIPDGVSLSVFKSYNDQIARLSQELDQLTNSSGGVKEITKEIEKQKTLWDEIANIINSRIDNALKKQAESIVAITDLIAESQRRNPTGQPSTRDMSTSPVAVPVRNMGFASLNRQEIDQHFSYLVDAISSAAEVLRSEFSNAWRDVFGEANSLLEKFAMNFFNKLAMRASDSIFDALLSFIPDGGLVSNLLGFGGSGSSGRPIVVINQMGNEEISRTVVNAYNQGVRRGF